MRASILHFLQAPVIHQIFSALSCKERYCCIIYMYGKSIQTDYYPSSQNRPADRPRTARMSLSCRRAVIHGMYLNITQGRVKHLLPATDMIRRLEHWKLSQQQALYAYHDHHLSLGLGSGDGVVRLPLKIQRKELCYICNSIADWIRRLD